MTRKEANIYLAVILETVAEAGDRGAPSGILYAALMGRLDLDSYQGLVNIAKEVDLIREEHYLLTITPKGRDMVKKIVECRKAS